MMKKFLALLILILLQLYAIPSTLYPANAQNFNVASTFVIDDKDAVSGDIIILDSVKGFKRTDVAYDVRMLGVLNDTPLMVVKEATGSGRPIIRLGEVSVNITDFNGEIKRGDYVTTSPSLGKGMKAGQSGYTLGVALEDAVLGTQTVNITGKQSKLGTAKVAIKIEFAELTTARNSIRLLDNFNQALFRNIQDPEKFTNTLRYIIAGIIAIIAFSLGFFSISRSVTKAVEAIGRNPLAKTSILTSVAFQIGVTIIGAIVTIAIIFIIIKF